MTRPARTRTARFLATIATTGAALALATPALATFPGDNGLVAFSRDGDIWTVAPDGTDAKQLTSGVEHDDVTPEWSADGREVMFSRNGHIYRMAADGSAVTWVRPGNTPQFSPDGKRIAYEENRAIYVADRDGKNPKAITDDHWFRDTADWSPINDLILWWVDDNTDGFGATSPEGVELGLGAQGRTDHAATSGGLPQWSPDGTRILHTFYLAPEHNCFSVPGPECPNPDPDVGLKVSHLDGSWTTIVGGNRFFRPTWSPDGSKIAAVDAGGITVMDVDGTNVRSLVAGEDPDWQPVAKAPPKPPEPEIRTVTVPGPTVTVQAPPPPPVVITRTITRTAKGETIVRTVGGEVERCVIPPSRGRLTLTLRATRSIKKGAVVKVRVGTNGKATILKSRRTGLKLV